jgi:hypothetical protein
MLVKEMTYVNFNGEERTEKFYFNLTKAEITEMEVSIEGGLTEKMNRIIASKDAKEIVSIFKKIVLDAYGEKSLDGRKFIKNDSVRSDFAQTQAYSDLFMELSTNEVAASEFMNGIIPNPPKAPMNPLQINN